MLSHDPVKRNINPYPYCDNDPVNYNDPTDFAAGTVGSALGQGISSGRIDIGESLLSGAGNALSEVLYGTGELKGVKDAFLRGARTGAVMSGLENLTEHVGSYGVAGERIFGKKPDRAVIPTNAGRDPKGMCGAADPFNLSSGLGNGRGYRSGAGHDSGTGGFSLGGFVRNVLTGAVAGGLGSAGFYGAGKAVERFRGSVVGRGSYTDILDSSNMMFRKGRDASYIEPMPKKQLQRIVKAFKRQGGIIQMDDVTEAYLASKNAEGVTLNENTILLWQRPGRASVYEELIHATQFRQGLNDASVMSRIQNEIAAQKMLLRNSGAYKLTPAEIRQTKLALVSYVKALQKLSGGN